MKLDGLVADAEPPGDRFVRQPFGQELEDLNLARCQRLVKSGLLVGAGRPRLVGVSSSFARLVLSERLILRLAQDERRVEGLRTSVERLASPTEGVIGSGRGGS